MSRMTRVIDALSRFFGGAAFPTFALAVLALYEAALLALAFVPPASSGLGAFAADFRAWCLGADPATGRTNWAYAVGMISPPAFVAAVIAWLWRGSFGSLAARPRGAVAPLLAAVAVVAAGGAVFAVAAPRPVQGDLPFPAEALRTAHRPPALRLTDQHGATVDLEALRGKVVLLTGVYASCSRTCPMIMMEAKEIVAGLAEEERADLRVVAVTLDPAHDTPAVLAGLASAQGLDAPVWHFVTGDSVEVERTLDRMEIARTRDPETGQIDHANLFLLVDRQGRLAYRFALGRRQQAWLASAVRMLLHEDRGA